MHTHRHVIHTHICENDSSDFLISPIVLIYLLKLIIQILYIILIYYA